MNASLKLFVALTTAIGILSCNIYEPALAEVTVIGSQNLTATINGKSVWNGDIPTVQAAPPDRVFMYKTNGEPCLDPSHGIRFTVTNLWQSNGLGQYLIMVSVEGFDSTGASTFSGNTRLSSGLNTVGSDSLNASCNAFDTKSLVVTTSVAVIGSSTKWTTTNTLPFEFKRLDSIPLDVDPTTRLPEVLIADNLVVAVPPDLYSQPKVTGYKYGLALGDTYDSLYWKTPTDVTTLLTASTPSIQIPISKIAPLLNNPKGYYTVVVKAINSVGESQSWDLVLFPLPSADLLAQNQLSIANSESSLTTIANGSKIKTITCHKGKITRKIFGQKPVCPSGYSKH